jgi:hypothetical protein
VAAIDARSSQFAETSLSNALNVDADLRTIQINQRSMVAECSVKQLNGERFLHNIAAHLLNAGADLFIGCFDG